MKVLEILCPQCSVRLRLRDASYIGRTIDCPDCGQRLSIVKNAAGVVECVATTAPVSAEHTAGNPSDGAPQAPSSTQTPSSTLFPKAGSVSPRVVGWAIGGVLLGLLVVLALRDGSDKNNNVTDRSTPNEVDPESVPAIPAPVEDSPEKTPDNQPMPPANDQPSDALAVHLKKLGTLVIDYRQRHGVYPPASPNATAGDPQTPDAAAQSQRESLGWMAELAAAQFPNGPQPLWDRSYQDPLNSRFVRRRMDDFLNPAFERQAAAEGYPAAHFAGMAGVGADAPSLPHDHPRAGVFGWNRRTSSEDIRDGASNVLLIVGVREGFRPWAAGGEGTIRALTQEPYINGPDGLGTGQSQGMAVLMADGSVRFLSNEISPMVFRRLAAMNDGLPLDEAIAGEPGEPAANVARAPDSLPAASGEMPTPPVPNDDKPPPVKPPDDAPIARPDPPKPVYDVEQALNQPILRYSQSRPVSVAELLSHLEELTAVPIDVETIAAGPEKSRLETPVTLELHDTTVQKILEALLAKAELGYESGRDFGLRILPKPAPDGT